MSISQKPNFFETFMKQYLRYFAVEIKNHREIEN